MLAFICFIVFVCFEFSDIAIQNIVLEAPWFRSCQRLCAYISCSALREVDTSILLSEILLQAPANGMICFSVSGACVFLMGRDIKLKAESFAKWGFLDQ